MLLPRMNEILFAIVFDNDFVKTLKNFLLRFSERSSAKFRKGLKDTPFLFDLNKIIRRAEKLATFQIKKIVFFSKLAV